MSDTAILEASLADFFLGPGEGVSCVVVGGDEGIDMLPQLFEGGEGGSIQRLTSEMENRVSI